MDRSAQNSRLSSDDYRQQQLALHESAADTGIMYGGAATQYAPLVAEIVNKLEVTHLLDYGCGSKLKLPEALKRCGIKHRLTYQAYDPCVPKYASPPVPAEMVACIDVLEHIEEDRIDAVLDDLEQLIEAVGVFTVCTRPALKFLPDGRNAHVLQRPPEWWLPRIMCRFELQTYQVTWKSPTIDEHLKFYVVVNALPRSIEATDGRKLT